MALVLVMSEGEVDNLRLRRLTGQHPADVTKVLGSLRSRGLLELSGVGRDAHYELAPAAVVAPSPAGTAASLEGSAGSSEGTPSPSSEGKGPSSEGTSTLSDELWAHLEEIARRAREQPRLDPAVRDDILVALCRRAPLSLGQLARLTGRSVPHLREALRAHLAAGRLAYLYPAQPSHPQQEYTASGERHLTPRSTGRASAFPELSEIDNMTATDKTKHGQKAD